MATSSPRPETITQLLNAVYPSFALLAGLELDLFTPLAIKPLSEDALASVLGVKPHKLRPLLYALVTADLLIVENGLFTNTPEADHYLVRGKSDYIGGLTALTANNWSRLLKTAATIRAGGPLDTGNYHMMSENDLTALLDGLKPGAVRDAQRLMDHYDFSSDATLLDVGGGSGALAITITQAYPHLHATVLDLPLITPITRQFVAEAQLSDRIEVVTGDAVQEPLTGSFNVVVARHVLQVLSANDNRELLRNIAGAVKQGGTLHLMGWILDNTRLTPHNTVNYNLILLTAYQDGQAYTEELYQSWLTEAGFGGFERVVYADGESILSATKL